MIAEPVKILFLASNPIHTARLQLEKESCVIQDVLRAAEYRDRFVVDQRWGVRYTELPRELLARRPAVVHFSGHGTAEDGVVLETTDRHLVPGHPGNPGLRPAFSESCGSLHGRRGLAVAELFAILAESGTVIRCVVLNACYSEAQARAIVRHVGCVVGLSSAVEDSHAISFAEGFYSGLFAGETVATAFGLGREQIVLTHGSGGSGLRLLSGREEPDKIELVAAPATALEARLEVGVTALRDRLFFEAHELLADLAAKPDAPPRVHGYLALAQLGGRSFNQLHPAERGEIEERLLCARRKAPDWDLPHLLLHTMEIDFYELHGLSSRNGPAGAPPARISQESRELIGQIRLSRRARRRFAHLLSRECSPPVGTEED